MTKKWNLKKIAKNKSVFKNLQKSHFSKIVKSQFSKIAKI